MLNTLKLKLICWLRSHDWKRAVRHTAVSGIQVCRRCGARRPVLLRTPARKAEAAPYTMRDEPVPVTLDAWRS